MDFLATLRLAGFVVPFLIATLVQVTLVVGATLLIAWFLRNGSAAGRHALLLAGLVSVLLIPGAILGMHFTRAETIDLRSAAAELGLHEIHLAGGARLDEPPMARAETARRASPPTPAVDSGGVAEAPQTFAIAPDPGRLEDPLAEAVARCAAVFLCIWGIGFTFQVVRFVRGIASARRLRGTCDPVFDERLQAIFDDVARQLSAGARPRLLQSGMISSPMVVGILRPAIVIPQGLVAELGTAPLRSVLMHEMAHVVRRDNLMGLLQHVVGIVWWPHPLVRQLNRQLSQAREEICDNYSMNDGSRHQYARTLLQLSLRHPTSESLTATVGLLQPAWRLEDRIRGLLAEGRNLGVRAGWMRGGAILCLLGAIVVLLAGATMTPPTEEEAIQSIRSLGGSVSGLGGTPGGTEQVMIMRDWQGNTEDLKQLKFIRGIKEIWFSGTTIDEVVLEDLPDLERIIFNVNFFDNAAGKQVNLPSLPIRTIRLKNLPRIRSFDRSGGGNNLSETQLTTLELAGMEQLTDLQVMGLQLEDGVLQSLSGLPRLTRIQACRPHSTRPGGHTRITDAGLESLQKLPTLNALDLSGARITNAGLKTIGSIPTLRSLGLNAAQITDNGLVHLAPLSELQGLEIGETVVTDDGLAMIVAQHPKLRGLAIDGSAITPLGMERLQDLSELEFLQVDSSQLTVQSCGILSLLPIRRMQITGTSSKPGHLSALPALKVLFVYGTENLTIDAGSLLSLQGLYVRGAGENATRAFLQHARHLKELEFLDLSVGWTLSGESDRERQIHVDDEIMQHVSYLKKLKCLWLDAAEVELGDEGMLAIGRLKNLEALLLPQTRVTDAGIQHLSDLANLKRVSIGGDGITNNSLPHFKTLKNLQSLYFYNTRVDQQAVKALKDDLPNADIQAYRRD